MRGQNLGAFTIPDNLEYHTEFSRGSDGQLEYRAPTVQAATDDAPAGYDAFISTWWTVDDYGTCFAPGSFKKTFREIGKQRPVLWAHDWYSGVPIGRHMVAEEQDRGAFVRVAINEATALGAEVMSSYRFGTPLGMSFGFVTVRDQSATDADPLDLSVAPDYFKNAKRSEIRVIKELSFWESSPLVYGSNPKAGAVVVRGPRGLNLTIPELAERIRSGTLESDLMAEFDPIVAACRAAGTQGGNPETNATAPTARRALNVEVSHLLSTVDPALAAEFLKL